MDVKRNIKKFREACNYSQEYVAGMLGITQQAYSLIENGPTKIDAELLGRLAVILHVQVSDFYTGVVNETLNAMGGKERQLFEQLIVVKDQLIVTKDQLLVTKDQMIESKDKVIELQAAILAKAK